MNVSLVIPVYNEEESLHALQHAIQEAMATQPYAWEVVYVDDGSADSSMDTLEKLAAGHPEHIRVVSLRRNFGQTTAIAAGIDYAQGEVIVLMDADLQNDPADIPLMLEKIEGGYDVVSGWRVDRQRIELDNPAARVGVVSDEVRRVEFEAASPPAGRGPVELAAYALYYVCEGRRGQCLYRRQDLRVPLVVTD